MGELTEDIGLDENVSQLMMEGNNEEAMRSLRINQISNGLNGNTELASGIDSLAEALGNELNKPKTTEQLKAFFDKKSLRKEVVRTMPMTLLFRCLKHLKTEIN